MCINTEMWFSNNVYEIVSIFVTVCVGVAICAGETEDLARGTLPVIMLILVIVSSK